MLRRRLFVLGIIALAVGTTAARSEPANRQFFVARRAKIDCTDDLGGTIGSPCRRVNKTGVGFATTQASPETEEPQNGQASPTNEPDRESINDATSIEEARGKKKKRGYLRVFFMMAAAAKATLLYAMIHAVALVAGKALVVAKVALALAAAVALKKALGEHHDKTSYEIVKHPHHSYVQTHSASIDYDHHGGNGGGGGGGGFEGVGAWMHGEMNIGSVEPARTDMSISDGTIISC